jgi:chaperonin GroEL
MGHKKITFQSAARQKILCGATQLADAVRITLGNATAMNALACRS